MIFAAGFGTRLKPLTDSLPKPSIKLLDVPLIYYSICMLVNAGLDDLIINTHYKPDCIVKDVNAGFSDLSVAFSHEPEILGTGGGLKKAENFLSDGNTFFLANSDIVADVDLKAALKFHLQHNMVATMILRRDPLAEKYGAIYLDGDYRIRGIINPSPSASELKTYMFTGIHLLSDRIFHYIAGSDEDIAYSGIISAYNSMIDAGESVGGYIMDGFWDDFGTIKSLNMAEKNPDSFLLNRCNYIKQELKNKKNR